MSSAKQKISVEIAKGDVVKITLRDNVLMQSSSIQLLGRSNILDSLNKAYFKTHFDIDITRVRVKEIIPDTELLKTIVSDILVKNLTQGPTELQRCLTRHRDGHKDYIDSESLTHRIKGTLGVYKKYDVKSLNYNQLFDLIDYIASIYIAIISVIMYNQDLEPHIGEDHYIRLTDLTFPVIDLGRISFIASLEVSHYAIFHVSPD